MLFLLISIFSEYLDEMWTMRVIFYKMKIYNQSRVII